MRGARGSHVGCHPRTAFSQFRIMCWQWPSYKGGTGKALFCKKPATSPSHGHLGQNNTSLLLLKNYSMQKHRFQSLFLTGSILMNCSEVRTVAFATLCTDTASSCGLLGYKSKQGISCFMQNSGSRLSRKLPFLWGCNQISATTMQASQLQNLHAQELVVCNYETTNTYEKV